jgi:hypothetical protein
MCIYTGSFQHAYVISSDLFLETVNRTFQLFIHLFPFTQWEGKVGVHKLLFQPVENHSKLVQILARPPLPWGGCGCLNI